MVYRRKNGDILQTESIAFVANLQGELGWRSELSRWAEQVYCALLTETESIKKEKHICG